MKHKVLRRQTARIPRRLSSRSSSRAPTENTMLTWLWNTGYLILAIPVYALQATSRLFDGWWQARYH